MPFTNVLRGACLLLAAVSAFGAESLTMRASKPEVRKEIVATIEAQLGAFRGHDLPTAYGFFAQELRRDKPLPLFVTIVQANYPEFLTSTRAEYGIVRDDGVNATVLVHVFGTESDAAYDFTFVREGDAWRVRGVVRHNPARDENV